jgi:hypothetical protein
MDAERLVKDTALRVVEETNWFRAAVREALCGPTKGT